MAKKQKKVRKKTYSPKAANARAVNHHRKTLIILSGNAMDTPETEDHVFLTAGDIQLILDQKQRWTCGFMAFCETPGGDQYVDYDYYIENEWVDRHTIAQTTYDKVKDLVSECYREDPDVEVISCGWIMIPDNDPSIDIEALSEAGAQKLMGKGAFDRVFINMMDNRKEELKKESGLEHEPTMSNVVRVAKEIPAGSKVEINYTTGSNDSNATVKVVA